MKVAVLGAGLLGVTSAWYLRQAGHEVTVVDRREGPGLETSFANGGQISGDHAAPWARPGVPAQALKWLFREDAPLRFRLRADPAQWRWGLSFLRNCTAERFAANRARLQQLARYSRALIRELRRETGLEYDVVQRGILTLHTDARALEPGMKTPEECIALEPAVASLRAQLVGGTLHAEDESGDAYKFTVGLSKLCEAKGVRFRFGFSIERLLLENRKISVPGIEADAYVVALGSYSPLLLRPVGIDIPVYPLKGYSVTMPVKDASKAWTVSLADEARKLVLSRLGDRLRIAGTAELNGYDVGINRTRCEAIVKRIEALFPGAGDSSRATFWAGLRPATPDGIPFVGRTRYPNLLLNTGHGTLGWTFACGSGRILADVMGGRRPEIGFPAR